MLKETRKQVVLEGEIQYLRNEVQELQQQLRRKDDIISVMLAPVSTDEIMAEEVSKLNSKLKEKEIETEKIRTSSDSLNKQIEELKQELDSKTGSMSLEYEDLRMEMDSLRKKNAQLQKQLNDNSEQADQEMTELLSENEGLKKNLNKVKDEKAKQYEELMEEQEELIEKKRFAQNRGSSIGKGTQTCWG